jgi:hypothetical protein
MSKIALTPSASGTGVFTISSPATNTDRTLTLPDITGTLVSTDASGNVGIGTSSPDALLDVSRSGNGQIAVLQTSANRGFSFESQSDTALQIASVQGSTNLDLWANTLTFSAGATERMRIDSSGNVGIGTSSPSHPLTSAVNAASSNPLTDGANYALAIQNTDATAGNAVSMAFGHGGYHYTNFISSIRTGTGTDPKGDLIFGGRPSDGGTFVERMRIDSSGNVLVGTTDTSPASNDVAGSLRSSTGLVQASVSGNPCLFVNRKTNDGGVVSIRRAGSQVGSISVTASATAYNTSSDYRLKTDAQPMSGASDRVLALKPVNFEWISTGTRVDGFLAHEAQEIVPEAVHGTKDAMRDEEYEVTAAVYEDIIIAAVLDEEGNELEAERTEQRLVSEAVMGTRSVPDYQGIDQSKLVPLLTAALQEALNKIEAMETRLAALEAV